MPGSPYLDETPKGLWTWGRLLGWLILAFIVEVVLCGFLWVALDDLRWVVYVILGLDLAVLIGFWVWTVRVGRDAPVSFLNRSDGDD